MTVEEAIEKRRSVRRFKPDPLTEEEIRKLVWSASKVPSAGGVRALKLLQVTTESDKVKLFKASNKQQAIMDAPVCFVISCDFKKIKKRYSRRGTRYGYMEAGHIGQNIALQAVSMGLGSVMIGAFCEHEVKYPLDIEDDPIYIVAVGRP